VKEQYIYVVWWKDYRFIPVETIIGFLPLSKLQMNSILVKAIFSDTEVIDISGYGGLHGVYENKRLAQEHLRLEKKWRCNNKTTKKKIKFGITKI